MGNFCASDRSTLEGGPDYWSGSGICPHHGRVRSGADGRRQYSRSDPNRINWNLRSGAGAELCRREFHGAVAAAVFFRGDGAGVRAKPERIGSESGDDSFPQISDGRA